MATLDWIGKKAVLNHHREVPYHLLKADEDLSVGDLDSGDLLVQGDNLIALKALLPYFTGRVKCVYIDPPYNTGDESWVYNDAVNSPEIRGWLGKVVGREHQDLSRHDKWLCMMYPRISLLRRFLRRDGMIFVSIDEHEVASLRLLMDEIFGQQNALGTLVWKRRSSSAMRGTPLSIDHEYVLAYGLDSEYTTMMGLAKGVESYPNKDQRGHYASTDLTVGMGKEQRPGQYYPLVNPRSGRTYQPNPERVWRFSPETMQRIIEQDLIIWPEENADSKMERPRYKTYYDPNTEKLKPISSWIERPNLNDKPLIADEADYDLTILTSGMTQEGGKLLQRILGTKAFAYPKPLSLVRSLIRAATAPGDLVLDSFAGTGTTGHAVLYLNKEDGGHRKFILVEMDSKICRAITRERLANAIKGYSYQNTKGERIDTDSLGGGFSYCELAESLFDANGDISQEVSFNDLAAHIFFTETGQPLVDRNQANSSPLLGIHNGVAVYLLFNGILGDKTVNGGNILTGPVLLNLPPYDGPKVIYGEGTRIGQDRLRREGIVFKQIPYEIRVS